MSMPFCTICENLGDTDGLLSCVAYPKGIPGAIYPSGCVLRLYFKVKPGMEEIARRWEELATFDLRKG